MAFFCGGWAALSAIGAQWGGGSTGPSGSQPPVVVEMRAGRIGRIATGSPQPPVVAEVFCDKCDVADVGSPQPPPGGGLLLYVASPSARLRGCPNNFDIEGIGNLSPGGGLHPRAARKQAHRSAAGFLHRINRAAIGGPQPPRRGGPQLLGIAGALRRLRPGQERAATRPRAKADYII